MTAFGPHEEFLGPSWQLDSSPLASTSVIFSGVSFDSTWLPGKAANLACRRKSLNCLCGLRSLPLQVALRVNQDKSEGGLHEYLCLCVCVCVCVLVPARENETLLRRWQKYLSGTFVLISCQKVADAVAELKANLHKPSCRFIGCDCLQ